jgi:hypothetical protein
MGEMKECEEKVRLLEEYQEASQRYASSVRELKQKIGTTPKDRYDGLHRASDEARVKTEQARIALEQHMAAHGC